MTNGQNYVASAMALVEHTRRIMRDHSGPIVDEFEQRKHDVVANPEVPFIHNLRNYVLHYSLPFIGHEVGSSLSQKSWRPARSS